MPCFDGEPRVCAYDDSLTATLRHNLGRVCSVHVDGEASPLGVTGVLSEVGARACKLISLTDSAPRGDCAGARRIHTIPLDKITCVDTPQF